MVNLPDKAVNGTATIHNFMIALAPTAKPDTAYYTRTFESLRSLVEMGGLQKECDNSFIRNEAQKLNIKFVALKSSIEVYIQHAWFMGNKQLMLEIIGTNIDTKGFATHPSVNEFLNGCNKYLTSMCFTESTTAY